MLSTSLGRLLTVAAAASTSLAIRVAPGSPCEDACGNQRDISGEELVCKDAAIDAEPKGQSLKSCFSCLQNSTFADAEDPQDTDQQWFLYNLRYAFDYCILGYPSGTGLGPTPCIVAEACGGISDTLEFGIKNVSTGYDYCDVGGGDIFGINYQGCVDCVAAEGPYRYLTNFLVAMNAGCQQKPTTGYTISLNETIFSQTIAEVVNPDATDESKEAGLSTKYIVAIAVCTTAFVVLCAACIWYQMRRYKRKQEARLANMSALSFYCDTQLGPNGMGGGFWQQQQYPDQGMFTQEYPDYYYPDGGMGTMQPDHHQDTKEAPHVDEKPYMDPAAALQSYPVSDTKQPLTNIITTTSIISEPPQAHTTQSIKDSPQDYHYTTPTSTTSYRSDNPLLSSTQAHHTATSPSSFSPVTGHAASSSPMIGSPLVNQAVPEDQVWHAPPSSRKENAGMGISVEAKTFPSTYPPPPKR